MKKSAFLAVASILCAVAASGATQTVVKTPGGDFLTNKSYWSDSDATVWPNPEDDYLFLNSARLPDVDTTFNGKSLQLGQVDGACAQVYVKGGNLTFNKLILANVLVDHWHEGNERWIYGPIEVISPVSAPVRFTCSHVAANGHALAGAITSESGYGIIASTRNPRMGNSTYLGYRFRIAGDLSGYYGTITIDENVPFTCGNNVSAKTCPGTIEMRGGSTLILPYPVSDLSVANISFAEGTRMQVSFGHPATPQAGTLMPTESLALPGSGPLTILMNTVLPLDYMNQDAPKYEILKVPTAVKRIALDDFELDRSKVEGHESNFGLPHAAHLVLDVDEGSGMQTLSISPRKVATLRASDSGGQSAFLPAYASHWNGMTDGEPLSGDVDYYVMNGYIRTPELASMDMTFRGASLTFKANTQLAMKNPLDLVVDNLAIQEGATIGNWGTARIVDGVDTAVLSGNMRIYKNGAWDYLRLSCNSSRRIRINSNISGSGNIFCCCANDGTTPSYELAGDNTSHSGSIILCEDVNYADNGPVLAVYEGRNLGGAMPSYTVYGVWLRSGTCLWAKNSLMLSEPTRGVYAEGMNCRFRADSGVTLSIDGSPLAINGQLVKEGAGTLALGGTLRFVDDDKQAVSPVEGKNLIHVKAGRLRALSAQGLAGAKISFAPGAAFAVVAPAGDEEAVFAQKGAVLTASSAPFDLSSAGSSPVVPVTFDVSGGLPERSVSVPAFTVTAATAQNLPVTGVSPVRGYAVRVAAVPGNGEVTYWATLSRAGMHITVR